MTVPTIQRTSLVSRFAIPSPLLGAQLGDRGSAAGRRERFIGAGVGQRLYGRVRVEGHVPPQGYCSDNSSIRRIKARFSARSSRGV